MVHIEASGEWWFPGHESRSCSGELTFDTKNGGTLTIAGSLLESLEKLEFRPMDDLPDSSTLPDRIFGKTRDGDLLTLEDVDITNAGQDLISRDGSGPSITNEGYRFSRVYSGKHLETEPEITQLTFQFPGLSEWAGANQIRPITDEDLISELEREDKSIQTAYFVSDPSETAVSLDNVDLIVRNSTKHSISRKSLELTEETVLILEAEQGLSVDRLDNEYLWPLRQYFTLALGKPVHPVDMTITLPGEPLTSVEVFETYPNFQEEIEVGVSDLNFRLSDVDFQWSLNHWFNHFDSAEQLHRFYFGYRYNDSMYVEFQFLSMVVSLESYYENAVKQPWILPKEEFEEILEDIMSVLPQDKEISTRVFNLLNAIGHLPSLGNQLEEVVDEYHDLLNPLLDLDQVVSDATTVRHQIAHGLKTPNIQTLVDLRPKLQIIVEAILYEQIGLEHEDILRILVNNHGCSIEN